MNRFINSISSVSVVIPCHNEEVSIEKVIKAVSPGVKEILVVDNNCTDRTAEIAIRNGVRVVFEAKEGYGSSLKCGFRNALGDIIVTLDGDNQYPPYKILDAVDFLISNDLDFVSASRFPLDDRGSMPKVRIVGNKALTWATNSVFGLHLQDALSGMWIFKRKLLPDLNLISDDMPMTEEIKIRAATNSKIRFAEYHIPYHPRLGDSKLLPFRDGWKMLLFLFKLRKILHSD